MDGPAGDRTGGAIVLALRGASDEDADRVEERAELESDSDAALVESGWASVTALVGVRDDVSDGGTAALAAALTTRTN